MNASLQNNDSDEETTVTEKRPFPSPRDAGPDKKTSRHRSVSRTAREEVAGFLPMATKPLQWQTLK